MASPPSSLSPFDFQKLFKELRHQIYADYMGPVTQALFSLTCKEYFETYGLSHHLLANTQRGLPNDQIVYSSTEDGSWDLMIWLINELSFPFEDDSGFYEIVDYAEELGKEGTEEAIDYAVQKKCDLSALLCDVALHQRKELLDKLMEKYQKKISVLNKLAIYTCLLDLAKIKNLVRNPARLSGKELDVILYSLGGLNEYSEELKVVIEWFLQFHPTLDQLIDPAEVDEEEEDDEPEEGFGYDGIIYNLISAGNPELLVKTLETVVNDGRFTDVFPAICARIIQRRNLDMLKAVLNRFPGVNGELLIQHFIYLLRDEWDNNVDVSYLYVIHGKRILQEEKEKLQVQFKCLEFLMESLKAPTFADLNCSSSNVFADFISWSDVTSVKWLMKRGFTLDMIDGGFIYSLQLSLFANEVAKFIVEEKLKTGAAQETLEWIVYLSLLRCDADLLAFLGTTLDLVSFFKRHTKFLSHFIKYVRKEGGLQVEECLVEAEVDGVMGKHPIHVDGELLDDDYRPLRVIEYVQKVLELGGQWDDECAADMEFYQGFLRDELEKLGKGGSTLRGSGHHPS